jgi:hypothetical protein
LNYIIGHDADPDGLIFHGLARRLHKLTTHFFAGYSNLIDPFVEVLKHPSGRVIVGDLSFQHQFEGGALLHPILNHHSGLDWYDHHNESRDNRKILEDLCGTVVVETNACASMLFQEHNMPGDIYAAKIVQIAQAHDFLRTGSPYWGVANDLQDVISSGFDLTQLLDDIAHERVFTSDAESLVEGYAHQVVSQYKEQKAVAAEELLSSIKILNGKSPSIAYALSPKLLYMKAGPNIMDGTVPNTDADILVTFFKDLNSVFVIGRNGYGVHSTKMCQDFGGGGRGPRGGFSLDHKANLQSYNLDIEVTDAKIRKYLQNNLA